MKKVLILVLLAFLASALGGAWYLYRNPEGYIHPQLIPPDYYWLDDPKNIYAKTGIVAIAGREFKIPIAYVDGRFIDGRMEGGVVLEYVLPEFKSKLEFPDKNKRVRLRREGRMKGMLLEEAAARPTLEYMATVARLQSEPYARTPGLFYDLEKYTAPKGSEKFAWKPDDLFIERDSQGKVQSFLVCSPPGKDVNPSCSHKFVDKKLLYKIRWKLSDLPNWRSNRDAAIEFIDQFEIQPREGE